MKQVEKKPVRVTAKAWCTADHDHTQRIEVDLRTRQEAINWCRFNAYWMKDFRIDGVPHFPA